MNFKTGFESKIYTGFQFSGIRDLESEFTTAFMIQSVKNKGKDTFTKEDMYVSVNDIGQVLQQYYNSKDIEKATLSTVGFSIYMMRGLYGILAKTEKNKLIELKKEGESITGAKPTSELINILLEKGYIVKV